jgi:putative transposase
LSPFSDDYRIQAAVKKRKEEKREEDRSMYLVRLVHLDKTDQLDTLAHACGELYSRTLVFFWRTVRHTGTWLRPKHLMRLFPNDEGSHLHAHTADACVQAFFVRNRFFPNRWKVLPALTNLL